MPVGDSITRPILGYAGQSLGAELAPMQRSFQLARGALGSTSPNPAVGAVVVRDGRVVGEGCTQPPGGPHAEIGALRQAGELARGADLYTTLEPCCTYGRTPPCTGAIISAGVGRVFVAARDPNPLVCGRGCRELIDAGIPVEHSQGSEAEDAEEFYRAFAKHINAGLPYVTAKFAMSLDGKIAAHTGDSKWVTGPVARRLVQELRRECDAILAGVNTVLADDPQLTARDPSGNDLPRQPLRVVLDSRCRTPSAARIFSGPGKPLIATTSNAPAAARLALEAAGAEIFVTSPSPHSVVDIHPVLKELGRLGVVNLLVEGGGAVLGTLFDQGLVDRVKAFLAPVIIGGREAASPVAGTGVASMDAAWSLEKARIEQVGPDWLISGYPVSSRARDASAGKANDGTGEGG